MSFHLASNVAWIIPRIVVATLFGFGVLFMIASTPLIRAFLHGCVLAAVVVTFYPLLILGQERSGRVASDLALLVREKRYIEFARQLEGAQGLSASDRTLFEGILANRRNQVSTSIRLLEPLAHTLVEGPADRAELGLCALGDDYAKSFRYGDARTPTCCSVAYRATEKTIPDVKRGLRANAGDCCGNRRHRVPPSLVLSRWKKIVLPSGCLRCRFKPHISRTIGFSIPEPIFLQSLEPWRRN